MINDLLKLKRTLRFNAEGSFKILVLADLHGKGKTGTLSEKSRTNVKALVDREQPDLILLNGDNTHGCKNSAQLKRVLDSIVGYFEEKQIPWAHVYGNRDDELSLGIAYALPKREQQTVYESYSYCISKNTEGLYGVGNYLLPILSARSDEVAFNLWCLDSNSYMNPDEMERYGAVERFDFIREDQIAWYSETSALLEEHYGKKIYGIMNFHIPLPEFETAWEERVNPRYTGWKCETICPSDVNSGLFEALCRRGDVKAIICGHDHLNDFAIDYRGVKLCYAGTPGYDTYHREDRLGARVITLQESDPSHIETYMSYLNIPTLKDLDSIPSLKPGILQDFSNANIHFNLQSLNSKCNPEQNLGQLEAKIVTGRGINGSAALAFTRHSTPGEPSAFSRNIELKIDLSTFGKLGNIKYLRFWMDLTGNDGRTPLLPLTAAAGLITDYNYHWIADFNTDYGPGYTDFYYLPENGTDWQTYTMTIDGCYGVVGTMAELDHEPLRGAKGWFAFPVESMLQAPTGIPLSKDNIVTTAYIYYSLDYKNHPEHYGEYVFIDDIALVEDYKVF